MIRQLALLAVAAICLTASATAEKTFDEKELIQFQKTIYDLLWHIDQADKVHPEIYKTGTSWDIEANIEHYTDKFVVKEFLQRYHYGMLPRGQIFSIHYSYLLDEAVALFKLFRSAGDIETFFKTACWARVHMNEGLFVYAFYLAVIHREYGREYPLFMPRPYEILPNYYFNEDVMHKAYNYKMSIDTHGAKEGSPEPFIVMANYTNWYASSSRDPETKLTYFFEDIDLNAFYFFFNLEYPVWMSSAEYKFPAKYRGEFYYYIHKTLINRYRMERYSHGLGDMEYFSWDAPIMTGYTPAMSYRNGFAFPQRKEWSMVPEHKYKFVMAVKEFETRVLGAIDFGFYPTESGKFEKLWTKEGINLLGNMVEGNVDSVHRSYYGSVDHFCRNILGFNPDFESKYQVVPSALEHPSTSLRDPAFYRMFERILSYFKLFKQHLGFYTHEELIFKGVKIESVAIDKLSTYFDWTDSVISNAALVHDHQDAESFLVKARQYRLNHKPFTYHMTITSDKKIKAVVRIFMGPKYNVHGKELDISQSYDHFYELDCFTVDLEAKVNKIERKSSESFFTTPDYESGDVFYKRILESFKAGKKLDLGNKLYGFPDRLVLPRGKAEGLPVQFFFYVSEFVEEDSVKMVTPAMGHWDHDGKPFGFPLDRPMYGFNFTAPNMYFKDASIFHSEEGFTHGFHH